MRRDDDPRLWWRDGCVIAAGLLALVLLPWLLGGCGGPLRVEMAPSADEQRWQQQITAAVNEHETRLRALEARAREKE